MRIVFVTNNYTPYAAGVVNSIQATIDALQKLGHDVLLVAPNFIGKKHQDPEWVRRAPSFFRFRYKKNYMALLWRPKKYLNEVIDHYQPDVVHVHHPFLLGSIAVSLARKKKIKTVFTYHTMYEAYAHYVPMPGFIVRPITTFLVLKLCRKVDQIVVPSSTIQQYLSSHGITHATVIPSGLQAAYLELPFTQKKQASRYRLLYVGRFVKEKNIPALFNVMDQLPDMYELLLVGYGDYIDELKLRAQRSQSSARIAFIENPDQKHLFALYESAHLFLFPSQTDTQGIVLAEAMAYSVPVIAFQGPGQEDSIQNGQNGHIVDDVHKMAAMIQHVMQDQNVYDALQKKAWETSHAFNPTHLVQRLMKLYDSHED
jgi:1,2-diacylglycerol 3-alpha-glucosyltransferase